MRKRPLAAAAVVTAVAAITIGTPTVADAKTSKEMKVCWTSPTGANYSTKVALDGPTSRSKTLANGECKSWSVKPGEYKVIWAGLDAIYQKIYNTDYNTYEDYKAGIASVCGSLPQNFNGVRNVTPRAYVKRFKNDYVTYEVGNDGVVRTTAQNNRQTRINFRLQCEFYTFNT